MSNDNARSSGEEGDHDSQMDIHLEDDIASNMYSNQRLNT